MLDGHFTVEVGVLSTIHLSHATLAELGDDLVVGDGLVDHGLVGGGEAFQFGEPVLDDVDRGAFCLF